MQIWDGPVVFTSSTGKPKGAASASARRRKFPAIDRRPPGWTPAAAMLGLALLLNAPAAAQTCVGTVDGKVVKLGLESALPNVTITLSSDYGPRIEVSGPKGAFRFLDLQPAERYPVNAKRKDYSSFDGEIDVPAGRRVEVEIKLGAAGSQAEWIAVAIEGGGVFRYPRSAVEQASALGLTGFVRWVLGIASDRENVAGGESAERAEFTVPGSGSRLTQVLIDCVEMPDPEDGSSPLVTVDPGTVEEIQVSRGGTDVRKPAPGATINVVTLRGSNIPKGSGRAAASSDRAQASSDFDPSTTTLTRRPSSAVVGNRSARAQRART